jgi:1,4-alpha-glucan branching enzyme
MDATAAPEWGATTRGYVALILHAHLPFVRHPEHQEFQEERWLFEAITETYLPLLDVFAGLERDRVPHRLAMSFSPPLLNMLADPLLQGRYLRHLDRMLAFVEDEVRRTRDEPAFQRLATFYRDLLRRARRSFVETHGGNLVNAFRQVQERGHLEILASAATHAFLPLLGAQESSVRAQVRIGLDEHRRFFGRQAEGFWLPEAAFHPELDRILSELGVRYVVVEAHGLLHAEPCPVFGTWAPIVSPAGIAVFGRDGESSAQVWSASHGYPGDFDYRDFYRDVGFDLDEQSVRPLLPASGERVATGIKYHRVTGRTDAKEPYVVERAQAKVEAHARNFVASRERQVDELATTMGHPPLVVAPYDAELFGHWWFEGPQWLDRTIRKAAYDQSTFALCTPLDYLARHPVLQESMPAASSWGEGGYNAVWLGGENDWIYPHLHRAAEKMSALARRFDDATGTSLRALNQAARELLLAQSSDWAFIMSRGTVVNYAVQRTRSHLGRFARLAHDIDRDAVDAAWLAEIEARDNVFPALDYRVFR